MTITARLQVVKINTGEIVHTVECHDKSERMVEKVERGLMMRTQLDAYYVDRVDEDYSSLAKGAPE